MRVNERKVMESPCTSYWLKEQIEVLSKRDPVDALADTLLLLKLQQEKVEEANANNYITHNSL